MNEYSSLRATLARLDEVRTAHNRRSSLNTGALSGGLDMRETGDEIVALVGRAEEIIAREIARGCRISHLKAIVSEYGASRSCQELIRDAELEAEYRRQGF